jgi:hypothetical protein
MKKVFLLVTIVVMSLMQYGCLKDDESNFYLTALKIKEVDMPESFKVGEIYEIEVSFLRPNGCSFFNGFSVTDLGMTDREVAVVGTVIDNPCTQEETVVKKSFNFIVKYDKDYTFKFWSGRDDTGKDTFIEVEVPVEE